MKTYFFHFSDHCVAYSCFKFSLIFSSEPAFSIFNALYLPQNSTSEFDIQVSNLSLAFHIRHRSFISNIEVFNLTSKF